MNWRTLKESFVVLLIIAAVVGAFLWAVSPANAGQRSRQIEAVPHVLQVDEQVFTSLTTDVAELAVALENLNRRVEETGIFRKPANPEPTPPDGPNAPYTPSEPPKFEFPTVPGEENATEAGLKDWSPEQWQSFFQSVIYIITAIFGLFGGGAAGGLFAKPPVTS